MKKLIRVGHVPMAMLLLGVVSSGCKPQDNKPQEKKPLSTTQTAGIMPTRLPSLTEADILMLDHPFRLEVYVGNPLQGFEVIVVNSSGNSRSILYDRVDGPVVTPFKAVDFEASREMVKQVREKLVALDFPSLQSVYRDPAIMDGKHILVRVSVGEKQKVVCCYNRSPDSIRSLLSYLQAAVVDPTRESLKTSVYEVPVEKTMPPFDCEN